MLINHLADFIKSDAWKSARQPFMSDDEDLLNYLRWSFSDGYLFYSLGENGFCGLGVAYPIESPYDGTLESILPKQVKELDESRCELVVMDMFAAGPKHRKNLIEQFCKRYPNWKRQKKWKYRRDDVIPLSNKYIEKLYKI